MKVVLQCKIITGFTTPTPILIYSLLLVVNDAVYLNNKMKAHSHQTNKVVKKQANKQNTLLVRYLQ